ncbi:MAG: enoyl-CoA hydratase/isomerase family protein [Alphaproteobacteria bacterium]|nr:enoyl-CoA hydratase/isomerase family protein [Alphaproteobacteria bacterium]
MSEPVLQQERRGGVLILTLDRPARRNALSPGLVSALLGALQAAAADDGVLAVVVAANGSHFCAGGDLGPGGLAGDGLVAQHRDRADFAALLLALHHAPQPVIAAVHGDALGGGAGLVAACHMVVLADDARISTPELKVGLFPWMIAPVLARKLPRNVLIEMIVAGRKLDAADARAFGLANRVVPADAVRAEALALADAAAAHSPAVLRLGMQALAVVDDQPLESALAHMHGQLTLNLLTEDAAEGIGAFLSRRPPSWTGR